MAGKKKAANNAALGAVGGGLAGRAGGSNLALGSLRGSLNGATRQSRIDSYLSNATGTKKKGR